MEEEKPFQRGAGWFASTTRNAPRFRIGDFPGTRENNEPHFLVHFPCSLNLRQSHGRDFAPTVLAAYQKCHAHINAAAAVIASQSDKRKW